jgi:hypothetical protein
MALAVVGYLITLNGGIKKLSLTIYSSVLSCWLLVIWPKVLEVHNPFMVGRDLIQRLV